MKIVLTTVPKQILALFKAPTGNDVTVCTNGNCQNQVSDNTGVSCDNRNAQDTCLQANFSSSLVDSNAGACVDTQFADSAVQCSATVVSGTCDGSVAVRSTIGCCVSARAHSHTRKITSKTCKSSRIGRESRIGPRA
jgi:hypothetical protein